MSTNPTKLQRWLDVVAFLAARRFPVSTEDLWGNVPSYAAGVDGAAKDKAAVRRMFERDKEELKELGIPIETVTFHMNEGDADSSGYRLARQDFHLPYLRLVKEAEEESGSAGHVAPAGKTFDVAEEEAGAALDGLRELAALPSFPLARHARSAFRKLAFDLEPEMVGEAPVLYATDPETAAAAEPLKVLSDTLTRRKKVAFTYQGMARDESSQRHVLPYGLLFQHGRWYLVARDEDRDGMRMFRLGRMSAVEPNPKAPGTPDYAIPSDFELSEYSGRKAWELGDDVEGPVDAVVDFRFPRSLWAERNEHGEVTESREDGGQLRRFHVHRRDPFLRWVLSLEGDARVVEPTEMRDAFRGMVGDVVRLYQGSERAKEGEHG
ncbi:MAG: WYL domain-containing protein [Gemmatimonadales bacterium]|nr:WYL domain-containing protein [Gemmatimonadales bacterium]